MSVRKLRSAYPHHCVSQCKIWTPQGGRIESEAHHEPLVGSLLACLVSRTSPADSTERALMQALLSQMTGRVDAADEPFDTDHPGFTD